MAPGDITYSDGTLPVFAALLRRHVAERPHHDPGCGGGGSRRIRERKIEAASQAEVEDLDLAVIGQEHVLGLEIAMDDALVVRRAKAASDLNRHLNGLAHPHAGSGHRVAERPPRQQLHHHEYAAVLHARIEDGDDIRMRQRRNGFCFAREQRDALVRVEPGEHLDGHQAIEPGVCGAIHLAHASGADGREDLVRTEARAGTQWQEQARNRFTLSSPA